MNSGMKSRRQKAQKARKGNSSLLPSVPFRGQSAIRKGRDEPPMDTDRHGWDGFLLIRVHPRSSAVQIRNPQSAIHNRVWSNPVKLSQTQSNLCPTCAEGPRIRPAIPLMVVSLPECARDGGLPPLQASRRTRHWQFKRRAQSNPVQPSQTSQSGFNLGHDYMTTILTRAGAGNDTFRLSRSRSRIIIAGEA